MTTMKQLTDKLKNEGGCIVASADCDTIELADARARGDFTVDDDGIGYVRRLPGWLKRHSRFARGATDSCEQRSDEMAHLEPQWLWRLKLTYWMLRYGYRRNPIAAWVWTGEDCWIRLYYQNGYKAFSAIWEDASYG